MDSVQVASAVKLPSLRSFNPPRAGGFARARSTRVATVLAVTDPFVAVLALGLVLLATNANQMPHGVQEFLAVRVTLRNVLLLAMIITSWPLVFRTCGLYLERSGRSWRLEMRQIACAMAICAATASVFVFDSISRALPPHALLTLWATGTGLLMAHRGGVRVVMGWRRRRQRQRVLIVGTGAQAAHVYETLKRDHDVTYDVVGFVDDETAVPVSAQVASGIVGTIATLDSMLMRLAVDEVFMALPVKSRYREIHEALGACERVGVRAKYRAELFQSELAWASYEPAAGNVVTLEVAPRGYQLAIKRALDLVGAACALIVAAPILVMAAIAIRLTSPGPVMFSQERYGLNRRQFRMFKFRTMVTDAPQLQHTLEERNEADGPVFKIGDDPRITRVGRFLRRTSIDELPQLFNVLRGDMSLVGPRPLPLRDVQRFTDPRDMRRCSVRPGLTCLWQISGRNNLSFDEWMRLDLAYIDSWSLVLDFLVLLRTVPAVLRRTGAR
jgi:exopolysaccharide biosynthesis polyprenyl glycosylphosphotransferase